MPNATFIARLTDLLGPKGVVSDPAQLAPYLAEWRGLYHSSATLVARPATTAEVAGVVELCSQTRTPLVPQGGNTGLVGGAVAEAGMLILSLARMNRIRALDSLAYTLTAEAGCILADVQKAAAAADRLFPLSLAAEGSCQIGGNLSTNAGGTAVLRYGNSRDLVLGIEAVLANGEIYPGLHGLRKDNTGYDLRHLLLGSEGTLGIITAAVLKLFPRPRDRATAFVAVANPQGALDMLALLRGRSGDTVTLFELMNRFSIETVLHHVPGAHDPLAAKSAWYALIELSAPRVDGRLREALEEGLSLAVENGWVHDAVIAQNEAQRTAFCRLREEISDAQKHEGGSIKHDISVPLAQIPRFLDRADRAVERLIPGVRPCSFGHVGDGNLHYNLSQPPGGQRDIFLQQWEAANRIVHDIVQELGGSFSAEHGIGKLKLHELERYKSPVALDAMRRIKRALDPHAILNPGKLVNL